MDYFRLDGPLEGYRLLKADNYSEAIKMMSIDCVFFCIWPHPDDVAITINDESFRYNTAITLSSLLDAISNHPTIQLKTQPFHAYVRVNEELYTYAGTYETNLYDPLQYELMMDR